MPEAIVFDFDGVIIESVGVKDRAFEALYAAYPNELPEIMAYHRAHNATLRFEKFEYIARTILNEPFDETRRVDLSKRFSWLVLGGLLDCPAVPGAIEMLEKHRALRPLFLVSKSPDEELAQVLERRGLTGYFKRVYAGSWEKVDALRDILKAEGLAPEQAVFIGDSPEDFGSARSAGVRFIGRRAERALPPEATAFDDLFEIDTFLEKDTGAK